MHILFAHGMGRSPLSAWPMLRILRRAGFKISIFGYSTALEDFSAIKDRLVNRIVDVAARGDYVLVGHSLGGVLLRGALHSLPAATSRPRHVFLLGSPISSSRLAAYLSKNRIFQLLTGDCGQLLASAERMAQIAALTELPVTAIVGTRGIGLTKRFFADEPNDGVLAVSEISADWIARQIPLSVIHSLLPSSPRVARLIVSELTQGSL